MIDPVIPGRASSREPGIQRLNTFIPEATQRLSGIQKFGYDFWIPGSRASLAPRNDGKESHHD
jgi:hypothetical protein